MLAQTPPFLLFIILALALLFTETAAQAPVLVTPFKCNKTTPNCKSLVTYMTPNTTTLLHIQNLFDVKNFRTLLGANNYSLSTPTNMTIKAKQLVNIPFPCLCRNGTGVSARRPIYRVVKDDGLYHIAMDVFSGLSSVDMISQVNGIKDKDLIQVGQKLWVPLPCSCDAVNNENVVHLGYPVPDGGNLSAIASQFGQTENGLMSGNGITDAAQLKAGQVLDIPLKACTSMINSPSLDYPLLVANGTYAFTANNCVMCKCDAANNFTLQCQPSGLKPSSKWTTCPSMQCAGDGNLTIGNSTGSGCGQTTCAYAGYTSQTILTTTAANSTCGSSSAASIINVKSWSLAFAVMLIHMIMLLS